MSIRAILTPEDMARGLNTPPGWYPAEIISYDEAVTKGSPEKPSDGSVNAIFTFKLLDGPTKGKEFKRYFNEKSLGFGKNLWAVLFPDFDKGKGGELSTEKFRSAVGKKVKVYVKLDTNGKWDTIEDYQPLA
jgi:hypothetical protein